MMDRNNQEMLWFEQVYAEYAQLMFRTGRRLLGSEANNDDIGDLVQDVFRILWQQRDQLKKHPNIGGWLQMTMKYRVINLSKGKRRRLAQQISITEMTDIASGDVTPDQAILLDERLKEIRDLLGEENAAMLIDYTLKGYNAKEVSKRYEMSESIVYLKVSRMRKKLAIALLMILLIALSVAGIAYCIKRGVLNFNEELGVGTEMVWHENAVELVESGIIQHIELEHVGIDVIETAYDGHELRVVYGVTSKMGQIKPIEGFEGSYEVPGAEEDGVHVCDYIRVNGQDAYFYDIYEAVGENPNQLLYYLQTNLTAWDIPEEEMLTIGLPMISGNLNYEDGMIKFSIPSKVSDGMIQEAVQTAADTGNFNAQITCAEFSPISGYVEILVAGVMRNDLEAMTGCRSDVRSFDGQVLTTSHPEGLTREDENGVTIAFAYMPPENSWPETMQHVVYMDDGSRWTFDLKLD